jgi:4-amino-4-deoxy-L-arabinose transferase
MVLSTYLFFSLATTKMPAFVLIVALPIYLAFGALIEWALQQIERIHVRLILHKTMAATFLLIIVLCRYNVQFLNQKYSPTTSYSQGLTKNKFVFTSLSLPSNTVLFNIPGRHYIESMFYTGFPSYNFVPTEKQYQNLKNLDKTIAIFSISPTDLPAYLLSDPETVIINETLADY